MHRIPPQWTLLLLQHTWEQELTIVAIIAWLTWDLLINVADEIAYLWKGHGKWIKGMYVFIRYAPIIHQGITLLRFRSSSGNSENVCRAWISWNLTFLELLTLAVEIILVIRVFALYSMDKILYKLIAIVFVVEIVVMIIILALVIPRQLYTPQCVSIRSPRIFIGYWVTSLIFEMFLFGLTLAKFLQSDVRFSTRTRRHSFMYIFMRDGTWAFSSIFASMLFSTVMYQLSSSPRAGVGYNVLLGVLSYSGSHVILNIRRLALPDESITRQEMGIPMQPMVSISDETAA